MNKFILFRTYVPEEYRYISSWIPLFSILLGYTGFGLGYGPITFILQGIVYY